MSGLPLSPEILIFGATLIIVFGGLLLVQAVGNKRKLEKRVERVKARVRGGNRVNEAAMMLRKKQEKQSNIPLLASVMKMLPRVRSLSDQLQRADMKISAQYFMLLCAGLTIGVMVTVSVVLHKSPMLGVFLAIIFGIWLPLKVVRVRIERRMRRFLKLFPDAIDLIVRGLRSGLPVAESMSMIGREVPEPVGGAFAHITNIMKLGVTMEQALQETAKYLDCTEFNFFTTSVVLQRETGGNLSEILSNLAEVLRKREMMQLKIKALTSEARASAWILGALPFLVGGGAYFLNPDFITPLIYDPRGNTAMGVAAGLLFTGIWTMRRMARFEM